MPWGSSNGAQVRKPKKLGVWTTTSPTLLRNSEWIHQICWVKQGVFPGFGLNKRPQKSTDIYPPYEGCKMDLLKCVKTVVDFLDHWNQQISVMWCDRRHFKCSSFALGYPQIVLERFDFKIFLGSTYMQSMCIYIYITPIWNLEYQWMIDTNHGGLIIILPSFIIVFHMFNVDGRSLGSRLSEIKWPLYMASLVDWFQ